jgi:hypothetical protein
MKVSATETVLTIHQNAHGIREKPNRIVLTFWFVILLRVEPICVDLNVRRWNTLSDRPIGFDGSAQLPLKIQSFADDFHNGLEQLRPDCGNNSETRRSTFEVIFQKVTQIMNSTRTTVFQYVAADRSCKQLVSLGNA